jgi:hypothetical protein
MLELFAPIYKQLIFEYLSLDDIVKLGEISKIMYNDPTRNDIIIERIIKKFGYSIDPNYWINLYKYDKMPTSLIIKLSPHFERITLQLDIKNVINLSLEDKQNLTIYFPYRLFFSLDETNQNGIINFLYKYMNDSYLIENIHILRKNIISILQEIFKRCNKNMKIDIVKGLITLKNNFKYKSNRKISINKFFSDLYSGDILVDIDQILEIGFFLFNTYKKFVKKHIEYYFTDYIEQDDDIYDCLAEEIENILDNPSELDPNKTYGEMLDILLLEAGYSLDELRKVNKERMTRYENELENMSDDD